MKEEVFESIAKTRVNLLDAWIINRWVSLDSCAEARDRSGVTDKMRDVIQ